MHSLSQCVGLSATWAATESTSSVTKSTISSQVIPESPSSQASKIRVGGGNDTASKQGSVPLSHGIIVGQQIGDELGQSVQTFLALLADDRAAAEDFAQLYPGMTAIAFQ